MLLPKPDISPRYLAERFSGNPDDAKHFTRSGSLSTSLPGYTLRRLEVGGGVLTLWAFKRAISSWPWGSSWLKCCPCWYSFSCCRLASRSASRPLRRSASLVTLGSNISCRTCPLPLPSSPPPPSALTLASVNTTHVSKRTHCKCAGTCACVRRTCVHVWSLRALESYIMTGTDSNRTNGRGERSKHGCAWPPTPPYAHMTLHMEAHKKQHCRICSTCQPPNLPCACNACKPVEHPSPSLPLPTRASAAGTMKRMRQRNLVQLAKQPHESNDIGMLMHTLAVGRMGFRGWGVGELARMSG